MGSLNASVKMSEQEIKTSAANGINESRTENEAKRSRGTPRKESKTSNEFKRVLRSAGSARVLRSRTQETRKDAEPGVPDPSNVEELGSPDSNVGQKVSEQEHVVLINKHIRIQKTSDGSTDSVVTDPDASMSLNSENLEEKNSNAGQLVLPSKNEAKRSGGTPREKSKTSNECNPVQRSAGSIRVLRSGSQEMRKDPEPSNNLEEFTDTVVANPDASMSLNSENPEKNLTGVELVLPSINEAKRSEGTPRTKSKTSHKCNPVLDSAGSIRVLRSRSLEKRKDPEPSNNLEEFTDTVVANPDASMSLNSDNLEKNLTAAKLVLPSITEAKRPEGTPRTKSKTSNKCNPVLNSAGSVRVLRSRLQEKRKDSEPSNYFKEFTDTVVANPESSMSLNSENLEKNSNAAQSVLPSKNEAKRSLGTSRKQSKTSNECKPVLRSSGSARVLGSRSQEKRKDLEPSNNLKEFTDSVVANSDDRMSLNSKNLEEMNTKAAQLVLPFKNEAKISRGTSRKNSKTSDECKPVLRSSGSTSVLRPRSQEKRKDPEPSNNLQELEASASRENRRKRGKRKKQAKNLAVDEFSRTRKHLKYLLQRMAYEQTLIDAYSGEGWKGQSAEKLRPEKELQRAKSEIFRCKLKVRDLFRHMDLSIAEGKLSEALFDSEGEIDSEDIICAKCGLLDVTLENDIILCDGACDRAFHQFCVQPPLLKEDFPPDDEGWLCPGCDCKDDCVELLNESHGTNLSVLDSWEKVYPEAAAAAVKTLENNLELPSDDSEDDDFKPDDSEVEVKDEDDESASDESDADSVSEDCGLAPIHEGNLQLSTDDSGDGDFDPDAVDVDVKVKQENSDSDSDFTSDSEDINSMIDANDDSPHQNSTMPRELMPKPSKVGREKRPSLSNELSSLLETASSQGESALISARRKVDRLDYKKLYDEQYGNLSTDSSDGEYSDVPDAPKRRRKNNDDIERTPNRKAFKKLDTGGTNKSPVKLNGIPSEPGSSCARDKTSAASRRLGETATQGLLLSFEENQYPERAKKEKLATELGITTNQVSKWFMNARWSYRHSTHLNSKLGDIPSKGAPAQINQLDVTLNISVIDVKEGDQSKEMNDVKAHVSIDNTKDTTDSLEAQQKVEIRGAPKASASSTAEKRRDEVQKLGGPIDASNILEKKIRGRRK